MHACVSLCAYAKLGEFIAFVSPNVLSFSGVSASNSVLCERSLIYFASHMWMWHSNDGSLQYIIFLQTEYNNSNMNATTIH